LNILLFGGQGQLGSALAYRLAELAELGKLSIPSRGECDVTDAASVQRCLHAMQPSIIINAAAYTDVDAAQDAPATTMAVNAVAPARLAEAANAVHALLVHYSSDYVFDGTLGRPYAETDTPRPLNVYGHSKWVGDMAAARAQRHLILRFGWLYSTRGRNFLKTMVARLTQSQRCRVVADQIGAPTSAALLADVTARLLARYARDPAAFPFGLYHVAAAGQTSWHGYACHIAAQLQAQGVPLAGEAIAAVSSREYPSRAPRPCDTRLNTARLCDVFGLSLPPWQNEVTCTLAELITPHRP